ncbi:hypothetical protein JRO89_XS13G0194200 [Xanthoceras sorbifolium]|uniref:Pentatricopeptide repeat-containing protein n=1 Tax=Xanthoceras sorbifolium TaxID=99658 RepID=A0ABQ8H984_9ROSI|nr:hypothetical protein JRO89_XS13G0194200 [Xanthoceras sorbifolium]
MEDVGLLYPGPAETQGEQDDRSGQLILGNEAMSMFGTLGSSIDHLELDASTVGPWRLSSSNVGKTIRGLTDDGLFEDTIRVYLKMLEYGFQAEEFKFFPCLIKAFGGLCDVEKVRQIHGHVLKLGFFDNDVYVQNSLLGMYWKCGDVKDAIQLFEKMCERDLVSWNTMISRVCQSGDYLGSLVIFRRMIDEYFVFPNRVSCLSALASYGLHDDVRIETALIEMYFKCGDHGNALKIFSQSQNHNLVMWSAVISNYAHNGFPAKALELLQDYMLEYGFPDLIILVAALRAFSSLALKSKGLQVHGLAVKLAFDSDIFVGGALVDMYGKCRDMKSAHKVFLKLPLRDLISWNALISGYSQNECVDEALKTFRVMQSEQIRPNAVTAASILSVCAQLSVMNLCKEIHCYLLRQGLKQNVLVNNSLIATYAKCGDINSSWTIFRNMHERNEVSWNSIILGLGMHGHTYEMFDLFEKMKEAGRKPDRVTFTSLISACSHTGRVDMGWKYFKSMVEDYKLEP